MSAFESFDGPSDLAPETKVECGVCWWVYDPAEGDAVAQIPPGVPFAQLPEDWRCPNCDAPKSRFLALGDKEA